MSSLVKPEYLEPAMQEGGLWAEAGFAPDGAGALAMDLLALLSGLTLGQTKAVLKRAEEMLEAVVVLDANAADFKLAAQGYRCATSQPS